MKAKTVVTWLLSLALSATVCAGLAGCGEDNGDEDPANFVSEKVTEEEWDSALQKSNFTNVKVSLSTKEQKIGQDELGDSIITVTTDEGEYIVTNDKRCGKHHGILTVDGKSETEEFTWEWYESYEDGSYVVYEKRNEEEWEVYFSDYGMLDDPFGSLFWELGEVCNFDKFQFSESDGGYVAEPSSDFAFMILKFKDKKLVWLSWEDETSNEDGQRSESLTISITYGGQTVMLPEYDEVPCGTYKLSEAKIILDGKPVTVRVGESLDGTVVKEDDMVVTLNQDGTAVVSMADMKGKGIVRQAGNTVAIMNLDNDLLKFLEFSGVWDGNNKLTISLSQNMTYILVKQP